MSILAINNLYHSFGDKEIFKNVSIRLLKSEHVALVGANGFGKSTLMNIITNNLLADNGTVEWSSRVKVGYMNQHSQLTAHKSIKSTLKESFQHLYDIEHNMNKLYSNAYNLSEAEMTKALTKASDFQNYLNTNDFYNIESKIEAVASGLGLKKLGFDSKVSALSGGQRTKVLLAKLLLEAPDILLLDEPTNYLDEEHIEWLTVFLKSYEKAFIVISHNMDFTNSISNVIWHVENHVVTRYIGNYEAFLACYAQNKKQVRAEFLKQQREIAKLEDYVRKNKARASTAKQAKSRQKKLEKIDRIELTKSNPKPYFNFKVARDSGQIIFEATDLVIGYNKPLTKPLNLKMERGQKIALTGANGIGKTTLLKSLLNIIKPLNGSVELGYYQHIGYYEQEIKEQNTNLVLDDVMTELRALNKQEVRRALAQCGLTYKHIDSQINLLSGGEQTKVRLCKLINIATNILILDEPTNHLDKDAKIELKRALIKYPGSILLVSHEAEFYSDIITDTWNCELWKLNN